MNDDFENLRKLIALKRYEQPPEGFVDDFLAEFQQRRDQAPVKVNPLRLFWERVDGFFDSLSPPAWGLAGAAAMALFAALTWMNPEPGPNAKGTGTLNPVGMEKPRSDQSFQTGPMIFTDEQDTAPDATKKDTKPKPEESSAPAPEPR